ncbi:hypothetical protein Taro_009780 [Colocasia esculenta]|uniref:Pentatricopeptide repeat-containing protein n=1 Tax=Colocasia esculenta TaxID=4460 RepID=A0A843U6L4_COLES|nr:hypothetical protein [Colocasia esculenta]
MPPSSPAAATKVLPFKPPFLLRPLCTTRSSTPAHLSDQILADLAASFSSPPNSPRVPSPLPASLCGLLTPPHVEHVLRRLRPDPVSVIRFFRWAAAGLHLPFTLPSLSVAAHAFFSRGMLGAARGIVDRMVLRCPRASDALEALAEGRGTDADVLLGFLVERYCRAGMAGPAVEAFLHATRMGFSLPGNVFLQLLTFLTDTGRNELILDISSRLPRGYHAVVWGYFHKGDVEGGLDFHRTLVGSGLAPCVSDCNKVANALCKGNKLEAAKVFLRLLLEEGPQPNVVTYSTLIAACCKEGKLDEAVGVFNLMPEKGVSPDLIMYSILIDGFCKEGRMDESYGLLSRALDSGIKLDVVIFSSVLDGFVRVGCTQKAFELYRIMLKEGISPNMVTYSILIKGLFQENRVAEACAILSMILKLGFKPTVVMYSTMMDGFCSAGNLKVAFDLYWQMMGEGCAADVVVNSVLIKGLCKARKIRDALRFLLKSEVEPTVAIYNILIGGFCKMKRLGDAIKMYRGMNTYNLVPDVVTFSVILKVMSDQGRVTEAVMFFFYLLKKGIILDVVSYCSLIGGLCKNKAVAAGLKVFHMMHRDGGYCGANRLEKAILLYEEMMCRGLQPNTITYTHLIDAFCKESRMDEAMLFFNMMLDRGPAPNVYTYSCLMDGYSKAQDMEKTFQLHEDMVQNNVSPNIVSYSVLIDGLCKEGRIQEASLTFHCAIQRGLLPDLVAYGILIHGFCKAGRLSNALMLYERMVAEGIQPDSFISNTLAQSWVLNWSCTGASIPTPQPVENNDMLARCGFLKQPSREGLSQMEQVYLHSRDEDVEMDARLWCYVASSPYL